MQTHREKDLGCAAFLAAKGHIYTRLIAIEHNFFVFEFDDEAGECARDAELYFEQGTCVARDIMVQLRRLKRDLRLKRGFEHEPKTEHTSHFDHRR